MREEERGIEVVCRLVVSQSSGCCCGWSSFNASIIPAFLDKLCALFTPHTGLLVSPQRPLRPISGCNTHKSYINVLLNVSLSVIIVVTRSSAILIGIVSRNV